MKQECGKLQWHPAFDAVLRIEFEGELDKLQIIDEYQLTRKPLQMDNLIIKKKKGVQIKKNIGRIFREHNIIEYKSPEDYFSVNDFYKVFGYACLYQSDTDTVMAIDPEGITLTFVSVHYPRKVLRHLEQVWHAEVHKKEQGIYYLEGMIFPVQFLITKELSLEDNYWLQHLRGDLKTGEELQNLMERYERHRHSKWYQAVMDLVVRANWDKVKEEKEMCEALKELFADELQESLEYGEERKLVSQICIKLKKNKSMAEIADALEEQEDKVRQICEAAACFAPDYDVDAICAALAAAGINAETES